MKKPIEKLTPKQADRLLNYLEVTTLVQHSKLTIEQARFYYLILNTFKY